MMAPVGMAMLYRVFPPAERVRAASILTIPTTVAPALGPVLGGFLVTSLTWRWVFFVNLPLGIAAIVFGALFLERMGTSDAGRFDVPGFVLGGAGLGLLMYGVSEGPLKSWSSPEVIFTLHRRRRPARRLRLRGAAHDRDPWSTCRLLSGRLFRSTNLVMFLAAAAFLGTLYLIPLYFQDARGLSALQSGLSTFPEAFGVMIGAQFASRIIYPRIGPRRHITGGLLGLALCMLGLTQVGLTTNLWLIRVLMFVLGWMMAQVMVPNQAASFAMITPDSMGRASTFFNTMRQVGSAVGVAVLSTVLIGVGSASGSGATAEPDLERVPRARSSLPWGSPWPRAVCSLTIHDVDAAETIVRRGRAARTARERPVRRCSPRPWRDRGLRVLRIEPGKRPRIRRRGRAVRQGTGRTGRGARLRRCLGRPDGGGGRRGDGGRRASHRCHHRGPGRA